MAVNRLAMDTGDTKLAQQISFLHHYYRAIKAMALCQHYVQKTLTSGYEARQIKECSIQTVKDARSTFHALKIFIDGATLSATADGAGDDLQHCSRLDAAFDAQKLFADLEKDYGSMMQTIGNTWLADIHRIEKLVYEACPDYQDVKETLLTEQAVVQKFLNSNKEHMRVGTLCTALNEQAKHVKSLHQDKLEPLLLTKTELKRANDTVAKGVELVAFTFVIVYIYQEIPKIQNLLLKAKTIEFVKAEVASRKVDLTTQMVEWLKGYADGSRTAPDVISEDAAVAASAVATPVQPVKVEEPAAPRPAAGRGAAASEPAPKKARLADRLKAKREVAA